MQDQINIPISIPIEGDDEDSLMENCGCNIQQDDDFKSNQDTCPIYNNAPNIAEKATDHVVEDNAPIFNRLEHSDPHNESNACVNYTFELLLDSDFDPDNKQVCLPQFDTSNLVENFNDSLSETNPSNWYIEDTPHTHEPLEPVSKEL